MLPLRLGLARIRLELLSKKLGLAHAIFQKARIERNWQNEPIDSTHQFKPICTLEYTGASLGISIHGFKAHFWVSKAIFLGCFQIKSLVQFIRSQKSMGSMHKVSKIHGFN